jgi:hypothetical protein
MASWQALASELKTLAERCLDEESPSPARARELASQVLSLLAALEGQGAGGGQPSPYRISGPSPGPEIPETAALVALERELGRAQARLAAAEAALRGGQGRRP